jgi:anhydro-N-acetylmuramic acid kinase
MRVAGVMSGTSLDGIDVAIVDIGRKTIAPVYSTSTPYPAATRAAILAVSNAVTHTREISRLNFALGELYAKAVIRAARLARIPLDTIELIGCHGQTIFHEGGNTLQIGEAAVIAERTQIPVVSNFRARDIAAGGQGAPLVPFFDYRLFRHPKRRRVALNMGGIANITVIPAGARLEDVTAFDTGPGNMVMDQLITKQSQLRETYDRDGRIAESGTPVIGLLDELLRDPYYRRKPPKSAGREQYGADFVARMEASGAKFEDLVTTAALLTVRTIANGVGPEPGDLIVSGGGVHNRFLMAHLHAYLPHMRIETTADYGIDADAKEAIAFALLAFETWHGRPSNVPGATGARHAAILGDITACGKKR